LKIFITVKIILIVNSSIKIVKSLDKPVKLISNLMLVEDIGKLLNSPDQIALLTNIFEDIKNIDLNDKSKDYFKNYLRLNKDFMVIFNRMYANNPDLDKNEKLMKGVDCAVNKNFNALKNLVKLEDQSDETKDFVKLYSDFFSSFGDVYSNINLNKNPEIADIKNLLLIISEGQQFLRSDEKFNNSSSKLMKIANRYEDPEIKQMLFDLIDYMKEVTNISENPITLENTLEVLYSQLMKNPEQLEVIADKVLKPILTFMNLKPKLRKPVIYI